MSNTVSETVLINLNFFKRETKVHFKEKFPHFDKNYRMAKLPKRHLKSRFLERLRNTNNVVRKHLYVLHFNLNLIDFKRQLTCFILEPESYWSNIVVITSLPVL